MTSARVFYRSAHPMRDHAPLVGVDAEFQRFLRLRSEREPVDVRSKRVRSN